MGFDPNASHSPRALNLISAKPCYFASNRIVLGGAICTSGTESKHRPAGIDFKLVGGSNTLVPTSHRTKKQTCSPTQSDETHHVEM